MYHDENPLLTVFESVSVSILITVLFLFFFCSRFAFEHTELTLDK